MILRGLGYGGSLASAGFGAWAVIGGSGVTINVPLITVVGGVFAPIISTGSTIFPEVITGQGYVLGSPTTSLGVTVEVNSAWAIHGYSLEPTVLAGSTVIEAPVAGTVIGRVLPILSPGYILYVKAQRRLWYDRHTNTLHYVLSDGKTILLQD